MLFVSTRSTNMQSSTFTITTGKSPLFVTQTQDWTLFTLNRVYVNTFF
uniref:Uncharacterized protein n=1 Tax=Anguilla anguilla TaxID=7936 RepID=A0A0E9XCR8_ANGAN